uniref:Uncharacterized protein n=1 Tax=Octopus bimaculoides TaxID=37653 RepID=A0A0L8HVW0_OCTBM
MKRKRINQTWQNHALNVTKYQLALFNDRTMKLFTWRKISESFSNHKQNECQFKNDTLLLQIAVTG